jgi:type I protein arginine methyltransferase
MCVNRTMLSEHLGYVSDTKRLDRYRQALAAVVRPGDTVADLGCGLGVLGLMCLEAGAGHVWGIDSSDAVELARDTMAKAGLAQRYTCIRDRCARVALPDRVDLLVCDHVGYFGVDYGIIEMMADARSRLLKPDGKIVPSRIRLMLAAAGSESCREPVEAWGRPGMPPEYGWLREQAANTKHALYFEPEHLATAPADLASIDLSGNSPDLLTFSAVLEAQRDGRLDGLAGWFECELADGIRMTNSPLADDAICRPQAFLPFSTPIEARQGDRIEVALSIRHDSGLITWSAHAPRTGQRQKQSTWHSTVLSPADLTRTPTAALNLNRDARARAMILAYVDGKRTAAEIVDLVLRDHPELFCSPQETARFIRRELARSTA